MRLSYEQIIRQQTTNKTKGKKSTIWQYVAENLIYKLLYQNYIIEAIKTN